MAKILGETLRETKLRKYIQQYCRCEICGKRVLPENVFTMELAHKIIQSKQNKKKYGEEIIHHDNNMILVCSKTCNTTAIIKFNSLSEKKLVEEIKKEIKQESCQVKNN